MFDQRGTEAGALNCPALQREMGASDLAVPTPAAVRSCAAAIGPSRRYYATADTVADIQGLMNALDAGRTTLDGVSYGSYVAERFAPPAGACSSCRRRAIRYRTGRPAIRHRPRSGASWAADR